MSNRKVALGIDFGTESGRALLVDVTDGHEVATAVFDYKNGVIDKALPVEGEPVRLDPEWALQDPEDYLKVLKIAVPAALKAGDVDPDDVIGIGIDFTSCTMLPTTADGTPLCMLPEFRRTPNAWVKLWKHHASQPEADRINEAARARQEPWLARYGGKISSEWFFSKVLQILGESPEVYEAADVLIEGGDWLVWQLVGEQHRNASTTGYKAMWSRQDGFPSPDFFEALDPRMRNVIAEKMTEDIYPIGAKAGGLTERAAGWMGLRPGTPVAVANMDAHVSVPGSSVTGPGRMVMIMGTSTCHILLGESEQPVEGICGVVHEGVVPGMYGYEAGQSGVGDIFGWFVDHAVPPEYHEDADRRGISVHKLLEEKAAGQKPGEHGLLALDWWNGNRSVLVDGDLSGLLIGATLSTRAEDIYRALIEATAYGTRVIIEAFEENGIAINEIVASGGLPERNPMMMQIYADVTGRAFKMAGSNLAGALGSAMFGAVVAGAAQGGYDTIQEAALKMTRLKGRVYEPISDNQAVYDLLYAEYLRLYNLFGRGKNQVMKTLKAIRNKVRE